MIQGRLFEIPEAVERQGEALFLKCPLYRAIAPVQAIYINRELFKQYIDPLDSSWENMSQLIKDLFTVTLDISGSSGEQIGWAFVDRQSDPLNLALSGNEGSGRAYYTGKNFNIKGEKTPLATATDIDHSNGVLEMKNGIWCSLIANSFYQNCQLSPVLAILDWNENYIHPESKKEVRRIKIVRLDIAASLDRITHLFYLKKSLTRSNLLAMARGFGQLDATKFMERILHGSWSNGNISPEGHLIDFDSVCAVKGRQPQFSQSSYYIDNYFSFELVAKLKVLDSVISNPQMNVDNICMSVVEEQMRVARDQEIEIRLMHLMGFTYSNLSTQQLKIIASLSEQFKKLSSYVRYKREGSFYTNMPLHFFSHLFDFSNFFRYFPLIKLHRDFDEELGFSLLVQSELIPAEEEIDILGSFKEEPLEPRVLAYLQDCFINNEEQITELQQQAYDFINRWNELYEELVAENAAARLKTAMYSYAVNEDRFYLFPVFDLSEVVSKLESAQEKNRVIQQIIEASRRPLSPETQAQSYRTDTRIFIEGITYIKLSIQGTFQIIFELKLAPSFENFTIGYNEVDYSTSCDKMESGEIKITSIPIAIQELLVPCSRDEVFKLRKYELLSNGKKITLHDYFGVNPQLQYYL